MRRFLMVLMLILPIFVWANPNDSISRINEIIQDSPWPSEEKEALDLLSKLNDSEYDEAIGTLDILLLLNEIENHPFLDQWYNEDLLKLFSKRAGALSIVSKERVISALQKGSTDDDDEEPVIRDLLLTTYSTELTTLKNLIDSDADSEDLEKLIFHDIDDDKIQREILSHFAKEAQVASSYFQKPPIKVLSDIDDTIYPNWVDERYPEKTVYPGVRSFYEALTSKNSPELQTDLARYIFITARPNERTGLIEDLLTHEMLVENGFLGAVVLGGDISFRNEAIAKRKLENFNKYRHLFPEYQFVFVGDNGQGDALLGQSMLSTAKDQVVQVFIHRVSIAQELPELTYFNTYVGAAVEAFKNGLIESSQLTSISAQAEQEFKSIPFDSTQQKQAQENHLREDVRRVTTLSLGGSSPKPSRKAIK